jgi:hypothetical protein
LDAGEGNVKKSVLIMSVACAVLLLGCSHLRPKKESGSRSVHEVVNKLKGELGSFGTETWHASRSAVDGDDCKSNSGTHDIYIRPTSAKVSLKTVLGREQTVGGSFEFPLSVLTISSGFNGVYTHADTNTTEIEFTIPQPDPLPKPIRLPTLTDNHSELYRAVAQAAREITLVNHQFPCLSPKNLKATIVFAVVEKEGGGLDIKVLGMKLGDKVTVSNEHQQTLEVLFSLAGSSEAIRLLNQ